MRLGTECESSGAEMLDASMSHSFMSLLISAVTRKHDDIMLYAAVYYDYYCI